MKFFGRIYGLKGKELRERVEEILELIKLDDRRKILASNLSEGMRRRLSLGVALLIEPKVLLLDEPTVGVDPILREDFWKYFKELSEEGKTILITTHYMDEAERCQVVGLILGGKIVAEGPPSEIVKRVGAKRLEEAFLSLVKRDKNGS